MNIYTDIINLFEFLYESEIELERQKCILASRNDFNVEDTFKIFETNRTVNYCLGEYDIMNGLNNLGIYPSYKDINMIINKYSLRKTGTLNYADFFDMLVPFDKEYRNIVENRKASIFIPKINKTDYFIGATKRCIGDLFEKIIIIENKLEYLKKKVSILGRTNIIEFIKNIDKNLQGYITHIDLRNFFKEYCLNRNINDRYSDLTFIRFDTDRDGKVLYSDIYNAFLINYY